MSNRFIRDGKGAYTCTRCGKTIKEMGQPAHIGWHKRQENKKAEQWKLAPPKNNEPFKVRKL